LLITGFVLRKKALTMREESMIPEVSLGVSTAGDGGGVSLRWTF
jgi:hypothetical protein